MKTRNIFIWIMLILGLTACSEEEVNTYSAEEGIYFNQRIRVGNILTDSTNFTFVYIEESQNEATVSIPVQLVGRAIDEPRPVNIKVVGGSAKEGDDFVLPVNPVLPAGASSFNYEITLKRSTVLQEEAKTIEIAIEENEYFRPIITHEITDIQSGTDVTAIRHKIEFSELFTAAPAAWYTYIYPFTPQCFFLTCRVMNIPRSDFNDTSKISSFRFQYFMSEMRKYVAEQLLLENPDPEIFDENGDTIF
ncbi:MULTISPECIES: DUF4843 domain-containing protein [Butyricimonas]|uniref:DUF4843 domain-containing protein n=1 Tax=Butyricimonas hominis TaxID=2763032 RepID=A0ABR7D295_9BACT|nr:MULTISPECIES: DUF4843 domain-containing protein [Butyricimonas]MBC5621625.1 DUF4843 domain-containing protein [Butyricimonas hominis]